MSPPAPRPPRLTEPQREILRLVQAHEALFHEGPSRALVAQRLRLRPRAVESHQAALVRKGLLASIHSPLTLTAAGRTYPLSP